MNIGTIKNILPDLLNYDFGSYYPIQLITLLTFPHRAVDFTKGNCAMISASE